MFSTVDEHLNLFISITSTLTLSSSTSPFRPLADDHISTLLILEGFHHLFLSTHYLDLFVSTASGRAPRPFSTAASTSSFGPFFFHLDLFDSWQTSTSSFEPVLLLVLCLSTRRTSSHECPSLTIY
jgi:hypothetical protein